MSVSEKQNQNGLSRWLFNAVIVWVALITSALAFHAFANTIGSFATFFNGTSIAVVVVYGFVFAFVYDRISGLWSPRTKRKTISLFDRGLENSKKRSYLIRLLDTIGFAIGVSIIFWGARYMASGGMLGDTDGEGVGDSSDGVTTVIIIICIVALESGGSTESDDDEDDKVSQTITKPGR